MSTAISDMWEIVEGMAIPEGYRVEIIGGQIVVSPQSETQWTIISQILQQLWKTLGEDARIMADVPIDFPGYKNGFAPDVAILADDAATGPDTGRYDWTDLDAVIEVVSGSSIDNDYRIKLDLYGRYSVPTYLIVDPLEGKWTLFTEPKAKQGYPKPVERPFGEPVDLPLPDGRVVRIETDRFPQK
ncbi:Uma2 family endonuclease [Kitasatospora sp. MAP5-34]|uniref:Uma2 family endonuclease n=1 Tax=Kitasatospora sp. MAP5-34 TaxID=3035102 RepID=UPI002475BE74|nr:Uma2 family endonuclease [Kitasatospora sp. MAP5-34]MDH6577013.1 Uma2 family endonuclease [Kitasatospora sp. MAP5-34]